MPVENLQNTHIGKSLYTNSEGLPADPRLPARLRKMASRALEVDPVAVERYTPREVDIRLAEAMLSGHVTQKDIAAALQVSQSTISRELSRPIVCAWVSQQVHRNVRHRLGQIDAAMLQRAVSGDVRAADLLYKRYGQMVQRNLNVNVSGAVDFTRLSDDDLDKFLQSKNLEPSGEDRAPPGGAGEGAPEDGGPTPVALEGPPPRETSGAGGGEEET